ncbi:hypothetical protein PIB30_083366 [Stylosanthes scabra]|uniref:Uncharacterized protein n=1 Tax=Stylosanthes scabra TaxID=79078 RepID=A0ABU6QSS0_9FABA|nr:hypothetical protein [Stylosanthes scabra]
MRGTLTIYTLTLICPNPNHILSPITHAYAYNPTHMRGPHIPHVLTLTPSPNTPPLPRICVQLYAYTWKPQSCATPSRPHRACPRIDHFYACTHHPNPLRIPQHPIKSFHPIITLPIHLTLSLTLYKNNTTQPISLTSEPQLLQTPSLFPSQHTHPFLSLIRTHSLFYLHLLISLVLPHIATTTYPPRILSASSTLQPSIPSPHSHTSHIRPFLMHTPTPTFQQLTLTNLTSHHQHSSHPLLSLVLEDNHQFKFGVRDFVNLNQVLTIASSSSVSVFDNHRFKSAFNEELYNTIVKNKKVIAECCIDLDEDEYPESKSRFPLGARGDFQHQSKRLA